jgi:uncharacterized protein
MKLSVEQKGSVLPVSNMITLKELNDKYKAARIAKDELRKNVYALLKSEFTYKEKEGKTMDCPEDILGKIIAKSIAIRQDNIKVMETQNREDMLKQETAEMEVLKELLPPEATEEEMGKVVDCILNESEFTKKDMGKAMNMAKDRLGKQKSINGKRLSEIIRSKL